MADPLRAGRDRLGDMELEVGRRSEPGAGCTAWSDTGTSLPCDFASAMSQPTAVI